MTPDTNMVERVARAICARERGDGAGECKTCREARYEYDPQTRDRVPVDLPAGCLGRGYVYLARVALTAMREPTEAMVGAGGATQVTPIADNWTQDIGDFSAAESYRAMIDAALAEGPKT